MNERNETGPVTDTCDTPEVTVVVHQREKPCQANLSGQDRVIRVKFRFGT